MDFVTNLTLMLTGNSKYSCFFTVVDCLIKYVQIIPYFVGNATLTIPDIAQSFSMGLLGCLGSLNLWCMIGIHGYSLL